MSIKHTFALGALVTALALLPGCASSPKPAAQPSLPGDDTTAESHEPDLVDQLRQRMASGPLQRQEKPDERQPLEATADTSRAPTVTIDAAKQQAAMAVGADYAKALALMSAGKDDDAFAQLGKISEKAPQFSGPLVNQALILNKQQKFAEAQALLEKALTLNSRNPFASNQLGIALRGQGKFADAKASYQTALAADPNYAKAHFNLGVLADLYLQDLPLALQHYQRYQSLQSKPDAAVTNWIVDLQKRTGTYQPPAAPAPLPPAEEPDENQDAEAADSEAATQEAKP